MSDTNWSQIRADYESGMSLRKLEAIYGISKSVIGERKFTEQWDKPGRTKSSGQRTADMPQVETQRIPTHEKGPMTDVQRANAQVVFLEAYAQQANVMVAAKAAGIHRTTVYDWLEHDEDFSFAYHQAKEAAKDVIRAEIFRRGHDGWDEPVYQMGYYAGTVRKYDTTLLIFHAKMLMPEYRDKQQVDVTTHTSAKDMQLVHDAIAYALSSYPEAKVALAEALVAIEKTRASGK